MAATRRVLLCAAFVVAACTTTEAREVPAAAPAPSADFATEAAELLVRFECNRCHDGLPGPEPVRDRHCVRCHQDIHGDRFDAPPDVIARWKSNIVSLRMVPSLEGVGSRLRRDWVRSHLLEPSDVRPQLTATMPRLALGEDEAEILAAFLVPGEQLTARFRPWDRARGALLYRELGCQSCHRFTGANAGPASSHFAGGRTPSTAAIALAPDLAFARQRLQPGQVEGWLRSPTSVAPKTLMPTFDLDATQARQLAAFILESPLTAPPPRSVPTRLPVLDRPVSYDEVSERVFKKICWHCHADPDFAFGDGGPGHSGGFGFPARRLDLSTYSGVASGSVGPDGQRRSVFTPIANGTPRLVAHLLARHREEAGTPVPGIRGMPLGLPALPPEDIQLVESWIAQGRPGSFDP
ncbi:MAG: cytochrome c [Deltaproteobacteria bacterium]|nr:cytochrome c [Deltaproteobacteria bacterium]